MTDPINDPTNVQDSGHGDPPPKTPPASTTTPAEPAAEDADESKPA